MFGNKKDQARSIIRSHVLWSMGGGLIPIPLVDQDLLDRL